MDKPTLISLFAGIGGLDLAAHWAGFETVRFVEKEPFCQKVLAKHWPGVPIDDDVFTSHPGHADVVCGGFPCQPFSVAGNRQGADDERYLLPEMLRIVSEVQPYAVLFENVAGFPALNDGAEFKYLLRTLTNMGFDAQWGHLRAFDSEAPHSRERWFLVAYSQNTSNQTSQYTSRWQSGQLGGSSSRSGKQNEWLRQSRLDGNVNGLPGRMDCTQFPAKRGKTQFSYEPPRTTIGTSTTKSRIKALGNAVVPQVAYPIFAALAEWFAEIAADEAA